MSLFEVKCPMCKGTLWIDPSTGKVVDHKAAEQKKIGLSEFLKSQQNRSAELEEKFQKAQKEKEKRKVELEEYFKRAKEQTDDSDRDKDEFRSPFDWD